MTTTTATALPGGPKAKARKSATQELEREADGTLTDQATNDADSQADAFLRINRFDDAADAFDRALASAVERGSLSDADHAMLERHGILRSGHKERELKRVARLMKLQDQAGTRSDRAESRRALELAENAAAVRIPQIELEIARLEDERDRLLNAVEEPREELRQMERAIEELASPNYVPITLQNEYEALRRKCRSLDTARRRAEDNLRHINSSLERIDSGEAQIFDGETNSMIPVGPELVERLEAERSRWQSDMEDLTRQYEAAADDRDRLVRRYVT